MMGLSDILVESDTPANMPKHVLVVRTFSTVLNDNHAVVQVMNIIVQTAITIYGGAKLGKFTPLMKLLLVVESLKQQFCQQTLSTIPGTQEKLE